MEHPVYFHIFGLYGIFSIRQYPYIHPVKIDFHGYLNVEFVFYSLECCDPTPRAMLDRRVQGHKRMIRSFVLVNVFRITFQLIFDDYDTLDVCIVIHKDEL